MQPAPRSPITRAAARPLILAIIAYALFLSVGLLVSRRPPVDFDRAASALVGHGNLIAWILTWSLYAYWVIPLCVVLIMLALAFPAWRARVGITILTLMVSWGASDLFQRTFMRARPLAWVVKHETAPAYPSTHATLAIAFYGFWFYLILRSELNRTARIWLACALAAMIVAIFWARLALGAHYPSDLAGGFLLGVAAINLAIAICLVLRIELFPDFLGP
ncbi:MAG: phosphatase PAP2 family protein [Candidatus Eremiobacteraeota bacterium]|nr:phosphatase PAP2 family protein [Candidatus Eremiobacteraeota bacterium]